MASSDYSASQGQIARILWRWHPLEKSGTWKIGADRGNQTPLWLPTLDLQSSAKFSKAGSAWFDGLFPPVIWCVLLGLVNDQGCSLTFKVIPHQSPVKKNLSSWKLFLSGLLIQSLSDFWVDTSISRITLCHWRGPHEARGETMIPYLTTMTIMCWFFALIWSRDSFNALIKFVFLCLGGWGMVLLVVTLGFVVKR